MFISPGSRDRPWHRFFMTALVLEIGTGKNGVPQCNIESGRHDFSQTYAAMTDMVFIIPDRGLKR
jgi:hypothetical protein